MPTEGSRSLYQKHTIPRPFSSESKSAGNLKKSLTSVLYVKLGKREIQVNALLCLESFKATSPTHHQHSWPLGLLFHFLFFHIVWSHFKNSNNEKVSENYDIAFLPQTCWFAVNAIILRYGKSMKVLVYLNMHRENWCYICHDSHYGQNRVTVSAFKACTYFVCAVGQKCNIPQAGVSPAKSILNSSCSSWTSCK